MIAIYRNEKLQSQLGEQGKKRVTDLFSFAQFERQIDQYVRAVVAGKVKAS